MRQVDDKYLFIVYGTHNAIDDEEFSLKLEEHEQRHSLFRGQRRPCSVSHRAWALFLDFGRGMSALPEYSHKAWSSVTPIVVVGAGPVGVHLVNELCRRDPERPIVIYGAERWSLYYRVRLSSALAGETRWGNLALLRHLSGELTPEAMMADRTS
ncbi:hypothetical protein [Methylocaldum sp.]|uniref:hypothetical protein n=1 Tax=Methylocaldum sp. TaxID=1969727 RepID=UPI002D74CB38|nr:hypothetical protein [Methylocaldum sp.]HYE36498.1 hypothetical protein [Methylocaldum sp.]